MLVMSLIYLRSSKMTAMVKKPAPQIPSLLPSTLTKPEVPYEYSAKERDLTIQLPDGSTAIIQIDPSKPMMDVLIKICGKLHLNPSDYSLQVLSSDSTWPISYTANQTFASTESNTLKLISKKPDGDKLKPPAHQPFEITQRVIISLPQNQKKFVLRVRPDIPLSELFMMAINCKGLDPHQYKFCHPTCPDMNLNMDSPLNMYNISEICLVSTAVSENWSDISSRHFNAQASDPGNYSTSAVPSESGSYMPGINSGKKKGFLSFLKRKKGGKLFFRGGSMLNLDELDQANMVTSSKRRSDIPMGSGSSVRGNSLPRSEPRTLERLEEKMSNVDLHLAQKVLYVPSASKKRQAPLPPEPLQPLTIKKEKDPLVYPPSDLPAVPCSVVNNVLGVDSLRSAPKLPETVQSSLSVVENDNLVETEILQQPKMKRHSPASSQSSGFDEMSPSPSEDSNKPNLQVDMTHLNSQISQASNSVLKQSALLVICPANLPQQIVKTKRKAPPPPDSTERTSSYIAERLSNEMSESEDRVSQTSSSGGNFTGNTFADINEPENKENADALDEEEDLFCEPDLNYNGEIIFDNINITFVAPEIKKVCKSDTNLVVTTRKNPVTGNTVKGSTMTPELSVNTCEKSMQSAAKRDSNSIFKFQELMDKSIFKSSETINAVKTSNFDSITSADSKTSVGSCNKNFEVDKNDISIERLNNESLLSNKIECSEKSLATECLWNKNDNMFYSTSSEKLVDENIDSVQLLQNVHLDSVNNDDLERNTFSYKPDKSRNHETPDGHGVMMNNGDNHVLPPDEFKDESTLKSNISGTKAFNEISVQNSGAICRDFSEPESLSSSFEPLTILRNRSKLFPQQITQVQGAAESSVGWIDNSEGPITYFEEDASSEEKRTKAQLSKVSIEDNIISNETREKLCNDQFLVNRSLCSRFYPSLTMSTVSSQAVSDIKRGSNSFSYKHKENENIPQDDEAGAKIRTGFPLFKTDSSVSASWDCKQEPGNKSLYQRVKRELTSNDHCDLSASANVDGRKDIVESGHIATEVNPREDQKQSLTTPQQPETPTDLTAKRFSKAPFALELQRHLSRWQQQFQNSTDSDLVKKVYTVHSTSVRDHIEPKLDESSLKLISGHSSGNHPLTSSGTSSTLVNTMPSSLIGAVTMEQLLTAKSGLRQRGQIKSSISDRQSWKDVDNLNSSCSQLQEHSGISHEFEVTPLRSIPPPLCIASEVTAVDKQSKVSRSNNKQQATTIAKEDENFHKELMNAIQNAGGKPAKPKLEKGK